MSNDKIEVNREYFLVVTIRMCKNNPYIPFVFLLKCHECVTQEH